jgi:broad specificity phosphatase PhoE
VAARSAPVLAAVDDWVRREPGRVAVVVSHNHVIRLRLASLLGLPPADYRRRLEIEPGSYSLIAMDGGERPPADGATIRRLGAMAVGREC